MRFLLLAFVVVLAACSSRGRGGRTIDSDGGADAARADASGIDAAGIDAGGADAGGVDSGGADAGAFDAGAFDAGARDAAGGPDGCTPPTSDTSAIGMSCTSAADCPSGYVCQPFIGFVLTQSCEIRCETACCPSGTMCQMVADKAGTWLQCNPT